MKNKEKKNVTKPPIVEIRNVQLSENKCTIEDKNYAVPNLIQYCKEQEYPVFDLPLAGIDLSFLPWGSLSDIRHIAAHFKRIMDADLSHPIILDDFGVISDGWHRVVKALVEGKETIKAIRIQEMPSPDGYENPKED